MTSVSSEQIEAVLLDWIAEDMTTKGAIDWHLVEDLEPIYPPHETEKLIQGFLEKGWVAEVVERPNWRPKKYLRLTVDGVRQHDAMADVERPEVKRNPRKRIRGRGPVATEYFE